MRYNVNERKVENVGITYKKLFKILEERNIPKTTLKREAKLSSATLAKLSKHEAVSMATLESICEYLNCQPGDILEFEKKIDHNGLLYKLQEQKKIKLKGGIYHRTQIQLAYNSNHIEGSKLTEDQTRYIYETNTVGLEKEPAKVDDIVETLNHFQCFDYMLEHVSDTLSEEFMKKIHKILKTNTSDSRMDWFNVGEYKSEPNEVGNMPTTPPEEVEHEIRKLLQSYLEIESITFDDILDFHVRFERIHPFQDGNGRVGRIIMFKECLKHNVVPFIIEDDMKMYYYRGLKEWDNEKGYLRDTCLTAQDRYKAYLDYFKIKYM